MELNIKLPEQARRCLNLAPDEEICYCCPSDVDDESRYIEGRYVVVTNKRLFVLWQDQGVRAQYPVEKLQDIKCEPQVGGGILTARIDGELCRLARFSMHHVSRIAHIAGGVQRLQMGLPGLVESRERDNICPRCGRALPGTRKCPHCDGSGGWFAQMVDILKPYSRRLLLISIVMIVAAALKIWIPALQQGFVDGILQPRTADYGAVWQFILLMFVATVLLIGLLVLKNWWCISLGARLSMDLRTKLYNKIQELSMGFIGRTKPGELMNRTVNDTQDIRQFMEDTFGSMLSTIVTMIGALASMLVINPLLTLLSVIFLPLVFMISYLWRKKIRRKFRNQRRKSDTINNALQDVLSGMRVVKSFGKEESESKRFQGLAEDFCRVQKNNEIFWAAFYPLLTFVMGIGVYVVTGFGGWDVLQGHMSVGTLMQFIAYAGVLYGPLGWMTQLPRRIMKLVTSLERIHDVLDEEPEVTDSEKARDLEIQGDIEFRNVSFGYASYEPVLKDINLHIKKGEMIGLVGSSGTGKSTMINLLMRLYNVDQGEILVDGVNINDISVKSLHDQIGVVLQETFLFSGTILENIRFAKPAATVEEVMRAAKMANAHDFICKTPDGYNTYVGEKGYNLSGGERQRISIARAILNNPKLLILDEATSALDTESEYQIQRALERLTAGRTTFAIAHRLSTLRNADRLVVLDGHNIAEVGSHNELLEKKGIYYNLVQAQMQMADMSEIQVS